MVLLVTSGSLNHPGLLFRIGLAFADRVAGAFWLARFPWSTAWKRLACVGWFAVSARPRFASLVFSPCLARLILAGCSDFLAWNFPLLHRDKNRVRHATSLRENFISRESGGNIRGTCREFPVGNMTHIRGKVPAANIRD